jgi:hypothetical protein
MDKKGNETFRWFCPYLGKEALTGIGLELISLSSYNEIKGRQL